MPVDVVVTAVVTGVVDVVEVAIIVVVLVVLTVVVDVVAAVGTLVVVDEEQDANISDVAIRLVSRIQVTPLFI